MLDQRVDAVPFSVPDPTRQMRPSNASEPLLGDRSTIGKSLLIKGEITGSESILIEGKVEGTIDLPDGCVTVGRSGRVSANIAARDIVVLRGRIDLGGDLGLGDRVGDRVGLAELAFDLDEERYHCGRASSIS